MDDMDKPTLTDETKELKKKVVKKPNPSNGKGILHQSSAEAQEDSEGEDESEDTASAKPVAKATTTAKKATTKPAKKAAPVQTPKKDS